MPRIDNSFEWPVAVRGYEIVEYKKPTGVLRRGATLVTGEPVGTYIRARGKKVEKRRPLEIRPSLFMDFAKLDGSPEQCLQFANNWGLPYDHDDWTREYGESIHIWKSEIEYLQRAIQAWLDGPASLRRQIEPAAKLLARLTEKPGGGFQVLIQPTSLVGAMRLQMMFSVAQDDDIQTCQWCSGWFLAGPGSERRRGSRFCSEECKIKFHNARRRKGAVS